MASSLMGWTKEVLMCGLKQVPIIGPAIEVVEGVQKRHDLLVCQERLEKLESHLTTFESRMRGIVQEEVRCVVEGLRQRDLNGHEFSSHIKNLLQIKQYGWSPALFQGLLEHSVHWHDLQVNPSHYGEILSDHEMVDDKKLHVFIDADKTRLLELTPIALHVLLAKQEGKTSDMTIEGHADVWALKATDESELPAKLTLSPVSSGHMPATAGVREERFANLSLVCVVHVRPGAPFRIPTDKGYLHALESNASDGARVYHSYGPGSIADAEGWISTVRLRMARQAPNVDSFQVGVIDSYSGEYVAGDRLSLRDSAGRARALTLSMLAGLKAELP